MGREVKFRAISNRKSSNLFGQFVYGSFLEQYYSFKIGGRVDAIVFQEENSPPDRREPVDKNTLCQFTGLKDNNDVEIYEGDIVQFSFWWFDGNECESLLTGTIVYDNNSMSFQLKGVKNKEWENFTGYENDTKYLTPFSELNFCEADFSVIGNVYQNPELLEQ